MSRCPSLEQLELLLANRLSDNTAQSVEGHIEECASCQEALERLTASADLASRPEPGLAIEADGPSEAFLRRLEQDAAALLTEQKEKALNERGGLDRTDYCQPARRGVLAGDSEDPVIGRMVSHSGRRRYGGGF